MTVTPDRPLADVRIVSLAVNLPGPLAASRLVSMGASVTKVEPPAGDALREVAPDWYQELTAGQEVVRLDLKNPSDRAELEQRLSSADVLLTSMRPSALDRLGLVESAQRHGLALVQIVGCGGDRIEEPGHDLTYQAVAGTVLPPTLPLVPVVDLLGAERAVSAVLAGLMRLNRGEAGPLLQVVLCDVAFDAGAAVRHGLTGPGKILGGALPSYGIYATADGHVAVGALEPHFASRLSAAVGGNREELSGKFATESSSYWEALGRSLDIPVVAVRDPRTVGAHRRTEL